MNVLLLRDVVAILLAGGAGERLYPLTRDRAKPAVSFGGAYRVIDFTLSNCVNSGLRKIFIATQYKAQSLNRHVRMGWSVVNPELGEFIEILPPQKRVGENWYLGTADAVYQNLYSLQREQPRWVIILSADHIYKMDYGRMLDVHIARGAALTIGAIDVPLADSRRFGILDVDEDGRVSGFQEKPLTARSLPWHEGWCLASMGIYIFDVELLVRELRRDAEQPSSHDFGRDIIPRLVGGGDKVYAHLFWDENKKEARYWRDIGTLDAYYEASMDLVQIDPVFNLYDPDWPLRTYQPQYPPAKFVFDEDHRRGSAVQSLVSMGCIVSGSSVLRSILSPGTRVHSYCAIEDSILMPNTTVHRYCRIRRAIVDREVEVPRGAVIGYDPAEDRRRHTVTEGGVVVVTPGEECFVDPQHARPLVNR
ncbi:MAG TPA: glucose-1-phosphate adenylyltransferase [Vicinamibacteria bacterium]|nr:glucose-1-phosphate adenylyltransferase [Vicinamibacteria bacterium]